MRLQKIIAEKYNSKVPDTMEDLSTLPSVACKTANTVLSNAYGVVEGMVDDTYVRRLSQRLGLTDNKYPDKIEKDLMHTVPKEEWFPFPHLIIEHDRKICKAVKPLCAKCILMRCVLQPSPFTNHAKRRKPNA